ncbi:hypothetical protein BKA67DRAFT_542154 [Truncatella angustata]|uniref:Coiled-coil domain-containing protein 16 n=1 Tax=Truncatella angustata TaxID=152316 RepID=A0A9P8RKW8_9PEZI|nr:uncharacterized protein BKA67DRAFT_542154 [Truncatella angustata]KAH6645175.1 hypothetical protein BKA67DRAFT_542154 [Truncatella angustata]KAH8199830.1 hypothetical protein TruAng_006000 [Truncatella angustata]
MADARSLLRAHRAANRVEHPHAAYSEAGKLLCKICREVIKSDTLWESHVRSSSHRQKQASTQAPTASIETTNKRKLDHVDDATEVEAADDAQETLPRKRNRTRSNVNGEATTPPGLNRRASGTPAQGVELSIPSRPATPQVGEGSQTSTPSIPPMGRSPFIGSGSDNAGTPSTSASAAQLPISTESLTVPILAATAPAANGDVDESEWAAFEAEIAADDDQVPAKPAYADATISAAPLTAEELAAKSLEEENERKKHLLDVEIADEKEDATRALEDEFDEMEQLESRVRKLKERREELRKGSIANLRGAAAHESVIDKTVKAALGKENAGPANGEDTGSDEDGDDDDEADDDWDDGFRFRGA